MLSFGKWLCCFESSIATSGAIWYIKLSISHRQVYEYIASTKKFCKCLYLLRMEVLNPKCQTYTRNGLSLVALARDFLPLSSVNARSLAIKFNLNYSRRANKLTRQPIRTTTRFSGSDVTGQHYRPVPSDVSLPRLSERRRWLKFRLSVCLLWSLVWNYCLCVK